MKIVYIHGANATSESFSYIRERIGGDDLVINYKSDNGFDQNLNTMIQILQSIDSIFFIAHSLGGVYALHLSNIFLNRVKGAVTLSTPYGGSREADTIKYFLPFNKLMNDVGVHSPPITKVKELLVPEHWLAVITVSGKTPLIHEENDGVVTLRSMLAKKSINHIEVSLNHYEVLLSDLTVNIIKEQLQKVTK